jgi:hypothetical protein
MDNKRRRFLKLTGLAGLGISGGGFTPFFEAKEGSGVDEMVNVQKEIERRHPQKFNMCGYAAPPIDTVRVGFIGVGTRGSSHVSGISKLEGVSIKAICDLQQIRADKASKLLEGTGHKPTLYSGGAEDWKKLCDRDDIDIVFISTPWDLHAPMALHAMNHGKHVALEVPAATTLKDCWQLVATSERTRKHCMMLENACYDFFELLTLNMARQGFFGEIIHCEGAYIHDLLEANFSKTKYWNSWRLKENIAHNGCLYPTHGMGPVCQVMNINRGDKLDYLVSVSGNDFMMGRMANDLAARDDFYKPYANKKFRGNMNITMMRTMKGRTIMIQHDVTSPRPYSRIHLISGTKGTALKYPEPGRISSSHEGWMSDNEMKEIESKYEPPIVRKIGELAKKAGGHGGMDFLMNWRTIDCLHNGLPLDQDVYDAALWSCLFPLSEWSVANRSGSISVPDFTGGSWKKNTPVSTSLERGGTTGVKIQ